MRRLARDRRLPSSRTLLQRTLAAFAGGSVFTADNHTLDGVNVGSFVDWLDASHTLDQATGGNQVLAPTADAALAGRQSTLFATGKTYLSSRAASTWKHLHDGTGGGMCLIWVPETVPASTSSCYLVQTSLGGSGNDGALLSAVFVSGPTYRTSWIVRTPTTAVISQANNSTAYTAGVGHAFRVRYAEGATPEAEQFRFGTQVTSGDSAVAPDTDDPAVSLTLGGATVQNGWTWRFHALFIPPADWTAAQAAAVSSYAKSLGLAGA